VSGDSVYVRLANSGFESGASAPALDRLLTHASAPTTSTDWRRDAFGVIAGAAAVPPVAAAALLAADETVRGPWVCIATPVHLVAGMSTVTLSQGGVLTLDETEAGALAADFNRVFADSGVRLAVGRAAVLLCVFDRVLCVTTHEPADVAGGDVFECQPLGADAPRLRRLMSEMELWLFEHAVNRARAGRGVAAITGLWLWGGGESLPRLPDVRGFTAGTDPLFAAYGNATEFPGGAMPRAGVLVCDVEPGAATWPQFEQRWLEPLSRALAAGELERLTVSVRQRLVRIERRTSWRFWRRAKPWWQSFGLEVKEA
jgi:hypothetical protein